MDVVVEVRDGGNVFFGEIEVGVLEVGNYGFLFVGFGDDGKIVLGGLVEKDLGSRVVVFGGDGFDGVVFYEGLEFDGVLYVEFEERGRVERVVGSDGDVFMFGKFEEFFLGEVGVVFDLEGGRVDFGVVEEVVD